MTATSVEVPPPSRVTTSSKPAACVTAAAPSAPGGRARQHRGDGLAGDLVGGSDAAVGLHDEEGHALPRSLGQLRRQAFDVPGDRRLHERADQGGDRAPYSRYSRSTSELIETAHSGYSSANRSPTRSSWAGLA